MRQFFFYTVFIIFLAFLFLGNNVSGVHASDVEITCSDENCSKTLISSLFPSSEIWAPGKYLPKSVKITNKSKNSIKVYTESDNFSSTGNLEEVLTLSIIRSSTGKTIWNNNLPVFLETSVALSDISPGGSDEFIYGIKMDPRSGNKFQGKGAVFDIVLVFSSIQPSPTSPDPSPSVTPSPSQSGSNSTGSSSSSDTSSSTDSDSQPTSSNTVASATQRSFKLTYPEDTSDYLNNYTYNTLYATIDDGAVLGKSSGTLLTGAKTCRNPYWWIIIPLVQAFLNSAILSRFRNRRYSTFLSVSLINFSALYIYCLFCCKADNIPFITFFGLISYLLLWKNLFRVSVKNDMFSIKSLNLNLGA